MKYNGKGYIEARSASVISIRSDSLRSDIFFSLFRKFSNNQYRARQVRTCCSQFPPLYIVEYPVLQHCCFGHQPYVTATSPSQTAASIQLMNPIYEFYKT